MKCVVTSFGSAGDFSPTLALAAVLRRRGHEVRFVANPFYEQRVAATGVDFVSAGARSDLYERFERNPAYGEQANFGRLIRELLAPNVTTTYRVIGDLLRSEAFDLVVGNDASFGGLWAAKERQVPSVLVHASPMIWMGWHAPLAINDWRLPRFLSRPISVAARAALSWYLTRLARVLAREVGTPLADVSFPAMEQMAALRLGLWSPLVRGPLASDPKNATICGFTRSSRLGSAQSDLPAEVEAFLDAGSPPVVVGLGSVFSLVAHDVLTNIAAACADKGLRCLIVGHPEGMSFPSNTLAVRYAPYDQVFSRAAAVVVHCGAGTTGEALRSGKPIIAVPFAYDQFWLAEVMEQLNVCVRVPLAHRTCRDFALALERVLADDRLRQRAADTGKRFLAERDGAEHGAEVIESYLATGRVPTGSVR